MNYQSISVFFPAYNEAENIQKTVLTAHKILDDLFQDFEIIVVDDGSKDKTGEIVERLAKKDKRINVIRHSKNQGYGAALISGFKVARKKLIFFTDADLQFDISEIKKPLKYIPEYDVVIGYRSPRRDPFIRLINTWGWKWLNRILFGLRVKDPDCAFKLFKKEVIKSIRIKSRGAMISSEMLIKLSRLGYKIKEVPVSHFPRRFGSPTGAKPRVILRAFSELSKMYPRLALPYQIQFLKYSLIGILNTALDWLIYLGLTRIFPFWRVHYLEAKALSYFIGIVNSYFWNRFWTFQSKSRQLLFQFAKFIIASGLALGANVGTMYLVVKIFQAPDLVGLIAATLISLIFGFSLNKLWTFAKEK